MRETVRTGPGRRRTCQRVRPRVPISCPAGPIRESPGEPPEVVRWGQIVVRLGLSKTRWAFAARRTPPSSSVPSRDMRRIGCGRPQTRQALGCRAHATRAARAGPLAAGCAERVHRPQRRQRADPCLQGRDRPAMDLSDASAAGEAIDYLLGQSPRTTRGRPYTAPPMNELARAVALLALALPERADVPSSTPSAPVESSPESSPQPQKMPVRKSTSEG